MIAPLCVLLFVLWNVHLLYATWRDFNAIMNLQRVRDEGKLTGDMRIPGTIMLYTGLARDFLGNMIPATVLFLDIPRELTISARLTRYSLGPDGWRRNVALRLASGLLDGCDPSGKHIRKR